ncbi:MAG: M15 family metallopeptidase [Clostridiales bacterium]|nr:M15 family metallopeptidase [Clostridiales bacterium]
MLVLVNEDHPLQDNYKPELQDIGNGEYFDARAADSLLKMLSDAKAEGLSPLVCSAYRDAEFQTELYNSQVEAQMETGLTYTEALEEAKKVVAYPGTSEHQLGLAVDIVASDYQLLDDGQAETEEAKWLMENCHKYGFILRYPPDKTHITGIIFEPWHYRYVGQEAATAIMSENLCLEEYLELYYDWQ